MMKNKLLPASAILLSIVLLVSPSNSADLGDGGCKDYEQPVSVQNWTGLWLGARGGLWRN